LRQPEPRRDQRSGAGAKPEQPVCEEAVEAEAREKRCSKRNRNVLSKSVMRDKLFLAAASVVVGALFVPVANGQAFTDVPHIMQSIANTGHQKAAWGRQELQMANMITNEVRQVQQTAQMLINMGDPSRIIGATGVGQLVGQTQGMIGDFQRLGQLQDYMSPNSFNFSYNYHGLGPNLGSYATSYGGLNSNNYVAYGPVEQAFETVLQTSQRGRAMVTDSVRNLENLTYRADAAQSEAEVSKVYTGILAQQTALQASGIEAQQRMNDLQAADIMARTQREKARQAAHEEAMIESRAIRGIVVTEQMERARRADEARAAATRFR
jgi:hypothetical protein